MKIAILGIKTYPALAGADSVVENLLKHFGKENTFYLYLTNLDNNPRYSRMENINFIYIPTVRSKHLKAFIFFLLSTLHVLVKGRYDIIHVHNSDFGLFNFILKLKPKCKILGTFHGNPYERDKWGTIAKLYLKISEFFFVRFSDFLTTVSERKIEEIPGRYRYKVRYIPNGISKEFRVSANYELLNSHGLVSQGYLLFVCGRLDKTKGLHTLVEAYSSIECNYKLLIIGDFEHDKKYSGYIRELTRGNERIISIEKLFAKPDLYLFISQAKLFVFPSEIEAMSMVLLEAIMLKVPVICSDIHENKVIVGDNYKYLFRKSDSRSLQDKILEALGDKNINSVVDNLYKDISSNYDWKVLSIQYENIYSQLLTVNV